MKTGRMRSLLATLTTLTLLNTAASVANELFEKQVASTFQKHCLQCHNDEDREGDFSLQTRSSAFASGLISPGDPNSSRLLEVITPHNGQAEMPLNGIPLSAEERNQIQSWIQAGAQWPEDRRLENTRRTDFEWWSYRPLQHRDVPYLSSDASENPIDAFIRRTLDQHGLTQNPEADRRTLIRRLTYDITGLPPTPDEATQFVNDDRPDAYERLVDRLLSSKRFGEHWARHWLDVVQYADTCGYDKDKLRPNAWPYRDYVIRSLNEDKPYTQFVQEQIAGDVLFAGDPDGIIALGFIAAGPWDFIGHVEVSESKIDGKVARNLDRDNMVSNTLNTFCSLTVQCARCHDHKFDPITQEDYYGLQSIFAAVDRAERPYDTDAQTEHRRHTLTAKLAELKSQQQAAAERVEVTAGPQLAVLNKKLRQLRDTEQFVKHPAFGYHSTIEQDPSSGKWVEIELPDAKRLSKIVIHPCHDDYAGIGGGFGFPIRFRVEISSGDTSEVVFDSTVDDFANPRLTPLVIEGLDAEAERIRVTATKLAERKNDYILALAELEAFDAEGRNVSRGSAVRAQDSIEAPERWARKNLTDGLWPRYKNPALATAITDAAKERDQLLSSTAVRAAIATQEEIANEKSRIEAELASLPVGRMVYAATTDFPAQGNFKPTKGKLRPVKVLHRGNVTQPKTDAVPGMVPFSKNDQYHLPAVLDDAERRAALAKWLTRDNHPLVWRSIVNRIWQYQFGRGIVASSNDFGRMGSLPTHPELLDWLAIHFRDNGQSIKKLIRLIVTSRTYRQSSAGNRQNDSVDSGNQYLWRMNRRRLQAEEIRDTILSVSGTLNETMGGPGFYLFALEKTAHSPHYEYHKFDPSDPKSHRRSIYRFVVRSQPDPWMTAFDCADSSQSTPRRNETLTALQALSLLNDRFNLVMAQRFADRLKRSADDTETRIRLAMELLTQRTIRPSESRMLINYADEFGLSNACRMLFNLNEFVFLD